jgi:uncharacterized membrane protein YhhN
MVLKENVFTLLNKLESPPEIKEGVRHLAALTEQTLGYHRKVHYKIHKNSYRQNSQQIYLEIFSFFHQIPKHHHSPPLQSDIHVAFTVFLGRNRRLLLMIHSRHDCAMNFARFRLLLFLVIPGGCAWLGTAGYGFVWKAGVAGSGILLLLGFCCGRRGAGRDVFWIVAAFAFSIAGDWFLSHRHGQVERFIAGIALFFLAHGGYLGFSLSNGRFHRLLTLALLTGFTGFYCVALHPAIPQIPLRVAVFLYMIISCLSLGAAAGSRLAPPAKQVYIAGIALVLFSDWIIAMNEFTHHRMLSHWILPTYYLAQISVTLALLLREQGRDAGNSKITRSALV